MLRIRNNMSLPLPIKFILCADDFGMSPGVSEGILELVIARRLSAVSCMMTQPSIRKYAAELRSDENSIDIGIHFVLTDLKALSPDIQLGQGGNFPSLGTLVKNAFTGLLSESAIRKELSLQLQAFTDLFGRKPDFIDGHHHIHQLPGIRDIIFGLIEDNYNDSRPYIRSCNEPLSRIFSRGIEPLKAATIGLMGQGIRHRARVRSVAVNTGFSGIYNFSGETPYATLFDRFTNGLQNNSLVICHPGRVDEELKIIDSLTNQRETEMSFFLSDEFPALLERKNLALGRFSFGPE